MLKSAQIARDRGESVWHFEMPALPNDACRRPLSSPKLMAVKLCQKKVICTPFRLILRDRETEFAPLSIAAAARDSPRSVLPSIAINPSTRSPLLATPRMRPTESRPNRSISQPVALGSGGDLDDYGGAERLLGSCFGSYHQRIVGGALELAAELPAIVQDHADRLSRDHLLDGVPTRQGLRYQGRSERQ